MNSVTVSSVTKKIGEELILDNISFSCPEGTCTVLLGKNGSGKSMLLKAICGFVRINSGEIEIFGEKVGVKGRFAPNTSCLIERPGFLNQYSGLQNLKFLATINKSPSLERISKSMRDFALDPTDKKRYGKYSLGMRQKLALAQAFMDDAALIILDEPTNNLDADTTELFRQYVIEKKKMGTTFIIATHDMEDIEIFSDFAYSVASGQLKEIV